MLKVYKECCKNCLLTEERITSASRAANIIKDVVKSGGYFICHKATLNGEEIACKNFYDKLGHGSQMVRMCNYAGLIEFVDQPDSVRLPSYKEMEGKTDV